ncbi:MAG: YggT family protein [Defluviitaleaceae bacterium]|nr:YggT family protein [Defluviitaleaceae bacterium]
MTLIIIDAVRWLFNILYVMLLIRVVLTWMPMVRTGRVVAFIFAFTEPMLAPVRMLIDRSPLGGPGMMLDFSPIITFFLLRLGQSFLVSVLQSVA